MAIVHSGSAGSTYAINPRVAANNHWSFSILGEAHTRTPQAVQDIIEKIGPLPPRNLPRFEEIDYATRVMTDVVLPEINPDVALIWFNEPDTSFHYKYLGSAETLSVMAHVDKAFARILSAIQSRSDAEDVAVLVASDHGQISSSGEVRIADLLSQAGHPAVMSTDQDLSGAAICVTGGNMGEIRVLDGDMDRRDAIARWLMQQDFTGMLMTPSQDPVHGMVEGTFSTQLVGLQHARVPELVYVLRSSLDHDPYGLPGLGLITGSVPVGGGMHGGLNRHELNTVLILGGSAATRQGRSEAAVGIIDIGPTILDLLGLGAPASMQGRSLVAPLQPVAAAPVTYRTGLGDFKQQLSLTRRGNATFLLHGERIA